jgi:hypothetical protein
MAIAILIDKLLVFNLLSFNCLVPRSVVLVDKVVFRYKMLLIIAVIFLVKNLGISWIFSTTKDNLVWRILSD